MSNTDEKMPLCAVHDQLDQTGDLILAYGNKCVACSLNERQELLNLIAEFIDPFADAVTCLKRLLEDRCLGRDFHVDWRLEAFARLGHLRDSMTMKDVQTVRNFLNT